MSIGLIEIGQRQKSANGQRAGAGIGYIYKFGLQASKGRQDIFNKVW